MEVLAEVMDDERSRRLAGLPVANSWVEYLQGNVLVSQNTSAGRMERRRLLYRYLHDTSRHADAPHRPGAEEPVSDSDSEGEGIQCITPGWWSAPCRASQIDAEPLLQENVQELVSQIATLLLTASGQARTRINNMNRAAAGGTGTADDSARLAGPWPADDDAGDLSEELWDFLMNEAATAPQHADDDDEMPALVNEPSVKPVVQPSSSSTNNNNNDKPPSAHIRVLSKIKNYLFGVNRQQAAINPISQDFDWDALETYAQTRHQTCRAADYTDLVEMFMTEHVTPLMPSHEVPAHSRHMPPIAEIMSAIVKPPPRR